MCHKMIYCYGITKLYTVNFAIFVCERLKFDFEDTYGLWIISLPSIRKTQSFNNRIIVYRYTVHENRGD